MFVLFVLLFPWVSPTARNIEPLRGSSGTLRVCFLKLRELCELRVRYLQGGVSALLENYL